MVTGDRYGNKRQVWKQGTGMGTGDIWTDDYQHSWNSLPQSGALCNTW